MNFLLSNLEVALEESHVVVGEKLFDEGKVSNLLEGQRNLWIANVDGFEVEIQISPSRVKAVSCECGTFTSERMCGHVVGGLFALRRHFLDKKSKPKKTTRKKVKVYHKLTTASILDNIDHEELKAFVGKYAKQNRNFALALSTRFASTVPISDNKAKYQNIFSQLLQGIRKKNNKISVLGVKQFVKTCHEFLSQASDAIVLKHYVESWAILSATIKAIPIILRNNEGDESELIEITVKVFETVDQLYEQPIPPELKTEIWNFFAEEAPKKSYRTHDFAVHFLERILTYTDDETKKKNLTEILWDNWKYKNLLTDKHISILLKTMVQIFSIPQYADKQEKLQHSLLESFNDFNLAIETAYNIGEIGFAKSLLEKSDGAFPSQLLQSQIDLMKFQLAVREKNKKNIQEIGKKILINNKDISVLGPMRNQFKKSWNSKKKSLLKEIHQLPSNVKNKLLPQFYLEENMLDELQDFLLNMNSLELVMQYDIYFVPNKMNELSILYRALLDKYLSEHFGEKPSKYMLTIFSHLRQINAEPVVNKLVEFVRKKYPRRMELAIELMSI